MNIEEKVKMNLLTRGFDNKTQLNNRGLIGATIDETILEVVKILRIADVISRLKMYLEVNAGRLCEPILKQNKNPKDDAECHKAFLMLAHLEAIENYVNNQ